MKVVVDTSSLISLVRYYLPFDKNNILFDFMKTKIESKEIIVLDKVYDECKYTSHGIVISSMVYLKNKENLVKTVDLLPSVSFFNLVENNFINGSIKNKLSNVEFEIVKNDFLNSADSMLLLYSIDIKRKDVKLDVTIITEETEVSNDNKLFKKIPALCKILEINCNTLPELLKNHYNIEMDFKSK